MCGIVGYAGNCQAAPILIEGLSKLEYRGYDSAGICVHNGREFHVAKSKGRLQILSDLTAGGNKVPGVVGIGHTRWATHGAPSDINSHPHLSDSGKIAIVHNGIIENEARLRQELEASGIVFRSETDTEVVATLIGIYYDESGDLVAAVRKTIARLEGSYALGVLNVDDPNRIVAVKKNSPLIFGFGEGENYIASDVPAILKHTQTVAYLNDGEMVVFDAENVAFFDAAGNTIAKAKETITWSISAAERGGYDHFMLKEIHEQPKALRDTISPRLKDGKVYLDGIDLSEQYLKSLNKICFVACGSAYYAAGVAKYILEKYCRITTEITMASEFRYSDPVLDEKTLVIAISQSGETADTLEAVREAKRRGARTLGIINVVGSAIAKAADQTIYTCAGPEIAVATTKGFTTQLAVVYLLTMHMAKTLGKVDDATYAGWVKAMEQLPDQVASLLTEERVAEVQEFAQRLTRHNNAFYIGRNLDGATCLEGSLKLKEVAYIHSECYPAGELKHGPLSLIEDGYMVVALATIRELFDKTIANVREVRARGADVLCVTLEELAEEAAKQAQNVIAVPATDPMIQPSLNIIPLQLLGYYIAVNRGCDVDKPRNLAKSVTVE